MECAKATPRRPQRHRVSPAEADLQRPCRRRAAGAERGRSGVHVGDDLRLHRAGSQVHRVCLVRAGLHPAPVLPGASARRADRTRHAPGRPSLQGRSRLGEIPGGGRRLRVLSPEQHHAPGRQRLGHRGQGELDGLFHALWPRLRGWVHPLLAARGLSQEENNGFSRDTTGLPTTDTARMRAFFKAELEHRGLSVDQYKDADPTPAFFYEQSKFEPKACEAGNGLSPDGTIAWSGGPARYIYVLSADSGQPRSPAQPRRPCRYGVEGRCLARGHAPEVRSCEVRRGAERRDAGLPQGCFGARRHVGQDLLSVRPRRRGGAHHAVPVHGALTAQSTVPVGAPACARASVLSSAPEL